MSCRARGLGLILLGVGLFGWALPAAAQGEALLELAFARAEAAAGSFQPYRYHLETRTTVADGDDVLEHEERSWSDAIQWSADSTETLAEGQELIFNRKAKPGDEAGAKAKEDKDEKKERQLDLAFDFFDAERRGDYRFEVGEAAEHGGRRLAPVTLKPRAKREGLWAGRLWLDTESGALVSAELEPAKGSFGVKHLDLSAEFEPRWGQDLPRWIAMDLEVKIPIVVHKHIRTRTEFSELARVP